MFGWEIPLEWYWILLIALGVFAVLAVLILLYKREWLRQWAATRELEPYVFQAIVYAYRKSEEYVDSGLDRLEGLDKKKLAMQIYHAVPDIIVIPIGSFVWKLEWKKWFGEKEWAEFIENLLTKALEFAEEELGELDEAIEARIKELEAGESAADGVVTLARVPVVIG